MTRKAKKKPGKATIPLSRRQQPPIVIPAGLLPNHPESVTYLAPLDKLKLMEFRGNVRSLTKTGDLVLSRALNPTGRGVAIDKLEPFAANEIEQQLIRLVRETKPTLFATCHDPAQALFRLRALHIPRMCRAILFAESKSPEVGILWLGALSAYSVAFERALLERFFRAAYRSQVVDWQLDDLKQWAANKLGNTVEDWFEDTEEGYLFWLSRFDQWHAYAMRSLKHYYSRQSIDCRRMTGALNDAAILGVLKRLGQVPEGHCAELLNRISANSGAREMVHKNATKRQTTPQNQELNHWLIECWSLVLEYGWNYRDLQLAANKRFEESTDTKKLDSSSALKDRCDKLGLKLGPRGASKVGRAKAGAESDMPPLFGVALKIEGLGADTASWFWGTTEAGFSKVPQS